MTTRTRLRLGIIVTLVLLLSAATLLVIRRSGSRPDHWSKGRTIALEPGATTSLPSPSDSVEPLSQDDTEASSGLQAPPVPLPERLEEYLDAGPKNVLQLQMFREFASVDIEDRTGSRGRAVLVNLNPAINRLFLLQLDLGDEYSGLAFELENPAPESQRVTLSESSPLGILLESNGVAQPCELWGASDALLTAATSGKPHAGLCSEKLFLRNPVRGRKTTLEWATDFLRNNILWGEQITVFVRETFYEDAFLETSDLVEPDADALPRERPAEAPKKGAVEESFEGHYVSTDGLGLQLESETPGSVLVGSWYPVRGNKGVWVSAVKGSVLSSDVLELAGSSLNPLDEIEREALVYLVAFDLDRFDLGFALGTDHPSVGWSARVPDSVRDPGVSGPDGFSSIEPLVSTGTISPGKASRVVATFTGGFKRDHGAFKWGHLAQINGGSHYGFIEDGVILSKLQPGLATVVVFSDGSVDLKTWQDADNVDLGRIRHARQNGLPIIETDDVTGVSRPGVMVPNWSHGNWSGSQDKRLRTLRAGLCLQESDRGRFLIYGYFSGATPSAMAVVFTGYACRYAMLLDMNALEHTYLAAYRVQNSELRVQHLIDEMSVLDKSDSGQYVARFLGFPDNRDFFFLLRKPGS